MVVSRWHDRGVHDQEFYRQMEGFHGPSWRVNTIDPTIRAATYPQLVALTRLLVSPRWRTASTLRPTPDQFVAELRATVAPRYEWELGLRYGNHEPLVQALLPLDQPRDEHPSASPPAAGSRT